MSEKYRFDHRSAKHRKQHVYIVTMVSIVTLAVVGMAFLYVIKLTIDRQQPSVSGPNQVVGSISGNSSTNSLAVNESLFTMSLPTGWKQINSVSNADENYITWQLETTGTNNKDLTIYIDKLPKTYPINMLLPIQAHGQTIEVGTLSDNCADFTPTSSTNTTQPVMAEWQGIGFWCNVPDRYDDQIGTGSLGSINSVTLTGPKSGSHNYFFVYIDHSAHPDFSVFYTILGSFQAK